MILCSQLAVVTGHKNLIYQERGQLKTKNSGCKESFNVEITRCIVDTQTKELAYYEVSKENSLVLLFPTAPELVDGKAITNAILNKETGLYEFKNGVMPVATIAEYYKYRSVECMHRTIWRDFENWRGACITKGQRMALGVEGSRQAGKTFAVEQYCYRHFNNVLRVSMLHWSEEVENLKRVDSKDFYTKFYQFLNDMHIYFPDRADSVLILDDVHENMGFVRDKLSLFLDLFKFQVIVISSYVGDTRNRGKLILPSVNIVTHVMFPLSFEEVLRAIRQYQTGSDIISEEAAYEVYLNYGGYPAIAWQYVHDPFTVTMTSLILRFESIWNSVRDSVEQQLDISLKGLLNFTISSLLNTLSAERPFVSVRDYDSLMADMKWCCERGACLSEADTFIRQCLVSSGVLLKVPNATYVNGEIVPIEDSAYYCFIDCGLLHYLDSKMVHDRINVKNAVMKAYLTMEIYRKSGLALSLINVNANEFEYIISGAKKIGLQVKREKGNIISRKVAEAHKGVDRCYRLCLEAGENNILFWEIYKQNFSKE